MSENRCSCIVDNEVWVPIPSLNNLYEVSNIGRIRNAKTQYVLKQFTNQFGYKVLQVHPSPHVGKTIRVHRVVAEAFLGVCPEGYVVNHKDGNKLNNTPGNLEYVTPSENNLHALDLGLRKPAKMSGCVPFGESHYNATITEETVLEIWRIRETCGYGARKISRMLNISHRVVDSILSEKTWKHVKR